MLKGFTVAVWNHGTSTKVNGIFIPGTLTFVKNIDCDLQPYSTALLLSQYGYNIECTKRIFMDFDSAVKIGTILKYTDNYGTKLNLEVKSIPWAEQYMEVMCLGV